MRVLLLNILSKALFYMAINPFYTLFLVVPKHYKCLMFYKMSMTLSFCYPLIYIKKIFVLPKFDLMKPYMVRQGVCGVIQVHSGL